MTRHDLIRVLVIDDSAFSRQAITRMLGTSPLVKVVGVARARKTSSRRSISERSISSRSRRRMPRPSSWTSSRS
jgi:DNA-binding NarL/FixJ family response regulator